MEVDFLTPMIRAVAALFVVVVVFVLPPAAYLTFGPREGVPPVPPPTVQCWDHVTVMFCPDPPPTPEGAR